MSVLDNQQLVQRFVDELNDGVDSIGSMSMSIHGVAARWGLRANVSNEYDGRRIEVFPVTDSESIGAVLEQEDFGLDLQRWEMEP